MSRKNSVKVFDTTKGLSQFKSFLKKPTEVTHRNKTRGGVNIGVDSCRNNRLRAAISNGDNKTNLNNSKSFTSGPVHKKRKKQPSESIESSRNGEYSKNSATLKLFANCIKSKNNQSFNSTIVCHKNVDANGSVIRSTNVSHAGLTQKVKAKIQNTKRASTS